MNDYELHKRISESLEQKARNKPSLMKLFKSDKARDIFFRALDEIDPDIAPNLVDKMVEYREKMEEEQGEESPIKVTFECEDMAQLIRLSKADAMAFFIHDLVHNGWRQWKHTGDYDYGPAWGKIHELLREFNINVDELD